MKKIITPEKDFMKKERYLCINCHKKYRYNRIELIDKGNKCEKCGYELIAANLRKY